MIAPRIYLMRIPPLVVTLRTTRQRGRKSHPILGMQAISPLSTEALD
jgi:hypothetical protein